MLCATLLISKGKLLRDQIHRLQCYAWNLCEIYDVTCCFEDPKKHLPYQCEFSDNGIVKKAQEAANKMNQAITNELEQINNLTNELMEVLGENPRATDIYVFLYDDGTLTFGTQNEPIEGKTVVKEYGNIKGKEFLNFNAEELIDSRMFDNEDEIIITDLNFDENLLNLGYLCDSLSYNFLSYSDAIKDKLSIFVNYVINKNIYRCKKINKNSLGNFS